MTSGRFGMTLGLVAILAVGVYAVPVLAADAPAAEAPKAQVPGPKAASAAAAVKAEAAAPAPAAETPVPPKTDFDALNDFIDKTKAPTSWFKWGADLRIRDEYLSAAGLNNNALTKGTKADETNWMRIRGRWWGTVMPVKNMDLNLRIEWEGRQWLAPSDGVTNRWAQEQVTVDSANIVLREVADTPLTLTLGRQDIILGDGWLVFDGTPADGSRTSFLDAARATYVFKEANTTADAIYINQNAKGNALVKPLLNFNQNVTEQNEQGFILWVTNRSLPKTEVNGYYMYKAAQAVASNGDDEHIHTFGARVAGDISDHWKYRAEGATQFGTRNDKVQRAFGFNSRLTYLTKDSVDDQLRVSFEYLSGDDPSTHGTNEAWDPLWGRWPQWSDLYGYIMASTREQRVYEATDLYRLSFGWGCKPTDKLELLADYHLLFAPENTKAGTAGFSDGGAFRGELLALVARYQFTPHLRGHLLAEFFWPGNFYASPRTSMATMLRGEIFFTW
jgi:hypothetical protein